MTKTNFYLKVYPKNLGYFGNVFVSGMYRTEKEEQKICEEIKRQILRHVDDVGNIYISWDESKDDK